VLAPLGKAGLSFIPVARAVASLSKPWLLRVSYQLSSGSDSTIRLFSLGITLSMTRKHYRLG
jgi:hypothetical protein